MTPDKYTIEEQKLSVGDGHTLYVQLWGNKNADEAILFLHGGPGGSCSDKHKTLFDPSRQKVIFFDQRGSGNSTPKGSLKANDTDHLVEDINKITEALGIKKFAITGGSWGSCLALVYAIRHQEKVTRMVLRGIFTARKSEMDYLEKGHFMALFPDVWEEYINRTPEKYRSNPTAYHASKMLGSDKKAAKLSAYAYSELEGALISIDDRYTPENYEDFDPSSTIIECYYMENNCFLPENYIMDNASKLTMPIKLVQGRYDVVCPAFGAYDLSKKLPNGELFLTSAGHIGFDRPNWDLVKALLQVKS